jgi:hypothetical protein
MSLPALGQSYLVISFIPSFISVYLLDILYFQNLLAASPEYRLEQIQGPIVDFIGSL